jgi:hypothetical protein
VPLREAHIGTKKWCTNKGINTVQLLPFVPPPMGFDDLPFLWYSTALIGQVSHG